MLLATVGWVAVAGYMFHSFSSSNPPAPPLLPTPPILSTKFDQQLCSHAVGHHNPLSPAAFTNFVAVHIHAEWGYLESLQPLSTSISERGLAILKALLHVMRGLLGMDYHAVIHKLKQQFGILQPILRKIIQASGPSNEWSPEFLARVVSSLSYPEGIVQSELAHVLGRHGFAVGNIIGQRITALYYREQCPTLRHIDQKVLSCDETSISAVSRIKQALQRLSGAPSEVSGTLIGEHIILMHLPGNVSIAFRPERHWPRYNHTLCPGKAPLQMTIHAWQGSYGGAPETCVINTE